MSDFLLGKMEFELKIRKYSPKTIKSYLYYNRIFFEFIKKPPKCVTNHDIKEFLGYLQGRGASASSMNLAINALKFYFNVVFQRKLLMKVQRPKTAKKLPVVLSKDEIRRLFSVIENPKHRLIIQFIYSTGVRVSEVVKIRVGDMDLDRGLC